MLTRKALLWSDSIEISMEIGKEITKKIRMDWHRNKILV